uniref:Germin-like protein n=1 Tax=Gossypium raimondii TaxID=29730 RepID=A0A0D2VHF4_GOSRA|nr:hypothetical protein B456_013G191000 [Gossypium raimondii]
MKGIRSILIAFGLFAFACSSASAYDPSPLQDFCVAIKDFKNGAYLWFESTMHLMVSTLPTLTPGDPRSCLLLKAHFMSASLWRTQPTVSSLLNPGDVFVFPFGLIHFQFNIGKTAAVAFAGLSTQNAGVITMAKAVLGSNPPINPDVLAKAFQLNKNVVKYLQSRY